jgi:hypothetical protein
MRDHLAIRPNHLIRRRIKLYDLPGLHIQGNGGADFSVL